MISDLNISHGNMSYFVAFFLLALTFTKKVGDLDLKLHSNTLTFFCTKNDVRFLQAIEILNYLLSNK